MNEADSDSIYQDAFIGDFRPENPLIQLSSQVITLLEPSIRFIC